VSSGPETTRGGDMPIPYRARLDERAFLNYPGFHRGRVHAYVEDTSGREREEPPWGGGCVPPTPRTILEIAD
jgi:hypothetical protein